MVNYSLRSSLERHRDLKRNGLVSRVQLIVVKITRGSFPLGLAYNDKCDDHVLSLKLKEKLKEIRCMSVDEIIVNCYIIIAFDVMIKSLQGENVMTQQ